jgi:hypothetical protein
MIKKKRLCRSDLQMNEFVEAVDTLYKSNVAVQIFKDLMMETYLLTKPGREMDDRVRFFIQRFECLNISQDRSWLDDINDEIKLEYWQGRYRRQDDELSHLTYLLNRVKTTLQIVTQ